MGWAQVLSLEAPLPLPLGLDGRSWYEMFEPSGEFISPSAGERRRIASLTNTRKQIDILLGELTAEGWLLRDIFFMGFSQGAVVAVDVALHRQERLGGVVAISASVLPEAEMSRLCGSGTPILCTHGTKDTSVSISDARQVFGRLQKRLEEATHEGPVLWREFDKGHEMVSTKREMQAIMEFFSQHLDLREESMEGQAGDEEAEVYEIVGARPSFVG